MSQRKRGMTQDSFGVFANLHAQIAADGEGALNQLAESLLTWLQRSLRYRFPRAPVDLIVDAAEDAIIEYGMRPGRFNPDRCVPLNTYLLHAARCNLINLLQSEGRRRIRETEYADYLCRFGTCQPTLFDRTDDVAVIRSRLLSAAENPAERTALTYWLDSDRPTALIADALGGAGLSEAAQRRLVKRFKDRITKRLQRSAIRPHSG